MALVYIQFEIQLLRIKLFPLLFLLLLLLYYVCVCQYIFIFFGSGYKICSLNWIFFSLFLFVLIKKFPPILISFSCRPPFVLQKRLRLKEWVYSCCNITLFCVLLFCMFMWRIVVFFSLFFGWFYGIFLSFIIFYYVLFTGSLHWYRRKVLLFFFLGFLWTIISIQNEFWMVLSESKSMFFNVFVILMLSCGSFVCWLLFIVFYL